ncbi:hypothetical protein D9M70_534200 [compost metagenome]
MTLPCFFPCTQLKLFLLTLPDNFNQKVSNYIDHINPAYNINNHAGCLTQACYRSIGASCKYSVSCSSCPHLYHGVISLLH